MNKLTLATVSMASICILSTHANSASFDCTKATTWVEKTICESPELSKLDEAMAKKYRIDLASAADYEDSQAYKARVIDDQRKWLKFQRDTCNDKACLSREYKERIEGKAYYGVTWKYPDELSTSDLPSKNAFGEFSQAIRVPVENQVNKDWKIIIETINAISINSIASKPYLSIIEGVLIFTNAHTCEIESNKATWSQNHWAINERQQDKAVELRLYPASYQGKNQLLLRDMDNKYRELHCGMRGYFDDIVLERE